VLATAADATSNVGDYGISQGTLSAGSNYTVSFTSGTLSVNKVLLTVTAVDETQFYDGQAYSGGNGVIYSGFVLGETASVLGGTLVYGGSSQGAVDVGSYIIAPEGLTSGNYIINFVPGSLTINAVAVPSWAAIRSQQLVRSDVTAGQNASSNIVVTYRGDSADAGTRTGAGGEVSATSENAQLVSPVCNLGSGVSVSCGQ
jgi:hypothetical protein